MSNPWDFASTPAGRVLKSIQLRGQATIKDVALDLGVTPSAVRLHMVQLQARGAVRADKVREGVGRPYYRYSVTPEAHLLFQNDYSDLTRLLLEELSGSHGSTVLQGLLRRVAGRLADLYRDEVGGLGLAERVHAWAELLDKRGITVELERTDTGYVLREYGCPYQSVAADNRAICEMELQVMSSLLRSGVELIQCVLDGHRSCCFTIAPQRLQG